MSLCRKCDRCGNHFEVKDVLELRYWKHDVGHYHTVHLCESKCAKAFDKEFLKGKEVQRI